MKIFLNGWSYQGSQPQLNNETDFIQFEGESSAIFMHSLLVDSHNMTDSSSNVQPDSIAFKQHAMQYAHLFTQINNLVLESLG